MASSRQIGSSKQSPSTSRVHLTSKPATNNYSIFTPWGIVSRLSDKVDSTVLALDKQSSKSSSILASTFYTVVLGIPLRVCRIVLSGFGKVLGAQQRQVVSVHRRSVKSRRVSSGRKSANGPIAEEPEGSHLTPSKGDGVKFDFTNSPDTASKLLNVISPTKRQAAALLSQSGEGDDEDEVNRSEGESSYEEDSSDDEVIDHMKLLNQSDVNYQSEEDSDFDPSETEQVEEEKAAEYDELNTSCDSEPPFEQVSQKSPCMTDHSVVELSYQDDGINTVKTAELCEVDKDFDKSHQTEEKTHNENEEMPLKSTENFADMDQNGNEFQKGKSFDGSQIDQENEPQPVT